MEGGGNTANEETIFEGGEFKGRARQERPQMNMEWGGGRGHKWVWNGLTEIARCPTSGPMQGTQGRLMTQVAFDTPATPCSECSHTAQTRSCRSKHCTFRCWACSGTSVSRQHPQQPRRSSSAVVARAGPPHQKIHTRRSATENSTSRRTSS